MNSSSVAMVLSSWLPSVLLLFYKLIAQSTGSLEISYKGEIGRCDVRSKSFYAFLSITFILIPGMIIFLLYVIMIYRIVRDKIPAKKLILTASAVVFTGLSVVIIAIVFDMVLKEIPEPLLVVYVALPFVNCICNPVIYVCTNSRVQQQVCRLSTLRIVSKGRMSSTNAE